MGVSTAAIDSHYVLVQGETVTVIIITTLTSFEYFVGFISLRFVNYSAKIHSNLQVYRE